MTSAAEARFRAGGPNSTAAWSGLTDDWAEKGDRDGEGNDKSAKTLSIRRDSWGSFGCPRLGFKSHLRNILLGVRF